MKRFARLLLAAALALQPCMANATSTINPALPANGLPYSASVIRGQFDSAINDINALQNSSIPIAITNSQLQGISTASTTKVIRLGVNSQGDSPIELFHSSNSACDLNGGNGDGGTEVKSLDSKCWIAPPGALSFEQFGITTGDNTTSINNAILASCRLHEPIIPLSASYNVATVTPSANGEPAYVIADRCGAKLLISSLQTEAWYSSISDTPIAGVTFIWTGGNQTTPFYLADLGPTPGNNTRVWNQNWEDVTWDCAAAAGCAGAWTHSTQRSRYAMTGWEPRPVYRTASGTSGSPTVTVSPTGLTQGMPVTFYVPQTVGTVSGCPGSNPGCAGQAVLPLTSTTGIQVGDYVYSGYIPQNVTVSSISAGVSVTLNTNLPVSLSGGEQVDFAPLLAGSQVVSVGVSTITLNANVQVTFSNQQVAFGGEGLNFGITHDLSGDVASDIQYAHIKAAARNTGTGVQAPGLFFGAVNQTNHGAGPSGTEYGNFSANEIDTAECSYIFGAPDCGIFNDSDHNTLKFAFGSPAVASGAIGSGLNFAAFAPLSGSPDGGPAHWQVKFFNGNMVFWGTGAGFASEGIVDWQFDDVLVLPVIGTLGTSEITCGVGVYAVRYRFDFTNPNQNINCNAAVTGNTVVIPNQGSYNSHFSSIMTNPAAVTGATCAMQGLASGAQSTPAIVMAATSGLIHFNITGLATLTSGAGGLKLYTGTGTPPANGAACSGTLIGEANLQATGLFTLTGLSYGASVASSAPTNVWVDIGANASAGQTVTLTSITVTADETQ